jgi:hypothetical protein
MNPTSLFRPIRRLAGILAALATPRRAAAAAAPAAFAAMRVPPPDSGLAGIILPPAPPGWNKHPPLPVGHVVGPVYKVPGQTVVIGGMPGWQIALIAVAAAVLAAAVAVILDRARPTRRHQAAPSA